MPGLDLVLKCILGNLTDLCSYLHLWSRIKLKSGGWSYLLLLGETQNRITALGHRVDPVEVEISLELTFLISTEPLALLLAWIKVSAK